MEKRREFYPGTKIRITDPFYNVRHSACGYIAQSTQPITKCPKCGGKVDCRRADEDEWEGQA